MPIDVNEVRERSRRAAERPQGPVSQPDRSYVPKAVSGMNIERVVVRSVNATAGEMYFQRIRYKDNPPVVGNYEAYGELERGYPLETAPYSFYEDFAWPAGAEITTLAVPMLAIRDGGIWILMLAPKFDASLLPADEPINECAFG